VLRATFSTSQLPKVLRHSVFYILTSTCASRHNGVHFFIILTSKRAPTLRCFWHFDFQMCFVPQRRAIVISHLPSWLCTRRFWGPTFRLSWAPSDFSTFSPASSFFRLFLFCDLLSSLLFSSRTFPGSVFSSAHIVGSLTSKLPSINIYYMWDEPRNGNLESHPRVTQTLSSCGTIRQARWHFILDPPQLYMRIWHILLALAV
jgi:hypothetical protein